MIFIQLDFTINCIKNNYKRRINMKKKILAMLLVVSMILVSFAACSKGDEETGGKDTGKTPGKTSESNDDGKSGDSGDVVKLKAVLLKHPLTQEAAKMEWLQKAEEAAGVDIVYEEISADWGQIKGSLLASGDIPDLIIGAGGLIDADFVTFKGLFQDMSELIDDHAPNIKKMFEEHPELEMISTQESGAIYGLPKYQRFWPVTASRQFINKQWLDNLGLEVPTTLDELYNVLKAFKEQDANGNGDPNDEIPMDWGPGFGFFHVTNMLGGYGITLSEASFHGYFVEDGVVKNFFTDERYKDFVSFLHKCYSEGLVNSEVFTQDYTTFQSVARGNGDTAAVGFTLGWEKTDRVGLTLAPQYVVVPPIKATANQSTVSWSYDYNNLNYGKNMISMSAACKNKEAAMKFIDQFYNPEVGLQVLFGSLGTNIAKNDDGSYSILPPADSAMDPGTWKWTSTMADNGPMYISDDMNVTLGTDMVANLDDTIPFDEVFAKIDIKKNVLPFTFLRYSDEDNTALALANTNIETLCHAKFATWIAEGGMEAEWDQYVKDANAAGIENSIKIYQKYYDAYIAQ